MAKSIFSKMIIASYAIGFLWWLELRLTGQIDTMESYYWGAVALGILPILSGFYGIYLAQGWGGLKSVVGRAIFFLSAGLSLWGLGSVVFAYYNIVQAVSIPYPSFADAVYIWAFIFWVISILNFARAAGAKYALRRYIKSPLLALSSLLLLCVSYYFIVSVARGGVIVAEGSNLLEAFTSLAYPVMDIIILTVAFTSYSLIYKFLGGLFRAAINIIFFAIGMNYIADVAYAYTTSNETFYVGSWVDCIFFITMIAISMGILYFNRDRLGEPSMQGKMQKAD